MRSWVRFSGPEIGFLVLLTPTCCMKVRMISKINKKHYYTASEGNAAMSLQHHGIASGLSIRHY
jgi:hypothetical protein